MSIFTALNERRLMPYASRKKGSKGAFGKVKNPQSLKEKNPIPHPLPLNFSNCFKKHSNHSSSLHSSLTSISYCLAALQIKKFRNVATVMANVVELKVGLHCDECIKKILKAIKKIEDIETYDVDTQLNKVTVTGNVTTEEVIKCLHKIGKQATNWDQQSTY
ncbi:uncharacterized protein LOC107815880 [Nicotiana tabacum]|uniref:Heavy metal-associated isoprenylated plant protein 20 n=1 Tax=Nicotiana tabacum TaxID=4097 RepID=A0A1S4C7U2_TOBAC|nr:PREDICTED: heavy metal-associated isoprenylated plant protein 20-like [Nicotiana tabacum]